MKRILALVSLIGSFYCLQAQLQVVPFGQRIPNLYYWGNNWYDSLACANPDTTFIYYPYYHIGAAPSCVFTGRYCETDSPIKIIGVAAPVDYLSVDSSLIHFPDSMQTEYFRLYEATDSGCFLKAEAAWQERQLFWMELRDGYDADTFEVRYAYFNEPVIVWDSFYVGGTSYNSLMRWPDGGWLYETSPIDYPSYLPSVPGFPVSYPGHYMLKPIVEYPYSNTPDWYKDQMNPEDTSTYRFIPIDCFIAIFPIFDTTYVYEPPVDTCPMPTGLHILSQDSTSITLSWNDNGTGNWELSYGTDTTAADNGTVMSCNVNFITLDNLDTATQYVAYVRSICNDTLHSNWSDSVHFYVPGDTTSGGHGETDGIIGNINLFTYLMPNPAKTQILVSSSYGLKSVHIFNVDGVMLEQKSAQGISTTVNIANLPKGVYIVRIVTPVGSAIKRLIVN